MKSGKEDLGQGTRGGTRVWYRGPELGQKKWEMHGPSNMEN